LIYANPEDVTAGYRLFLGREPDAGGYANFSRLVSTGTVTTLELARLFFSSPEFAAVQRRYKQEADQIERVALADFPIMMDTAPAWNPINQTIARDKVYERGLTREVSSVCKDGMVFVDCGANIGYYTMLACHLGARVFSFEPNAKNVWLLSNNLTINGFSAEIYPYAVADKEQIMVYNSNDGNGQLEPFSGFELAEGQEIVRTVVLDNVLEQVRVDAMKIDIEGAEWLALTGASRILEHDRPILFVEFSPGPLQTVSKIAPLDYLQRLEKLNYKIEMIGPDHSTPYAAAEVISVMQQSDTQLVDLKLTPIR
jgi:FkbM family methyltransferase